jgi:hypothetical protein
MIKHKEIAGPSCLTRADINEPLFVLRANDELAPLIVRRWANLYISSKGVFATERQIAKFSEAMALAIQMESWRAARNIRDAAASK